MAIAPPAADLDLPPAAPAVRGEHGDPLAGLDRAALDAATVKVAAAHWDRLGRSTASVLSKRFWDDKLMRWATGDESLKVQAFRFVDVLPSLRTHAAVTRHLREYFTDVSKLPAAARLAMNGDPGSMVGKALAVGARSTARQMAERFIAGETVPEVVKAVRDLRRDGYAFTLDLLGEAVVSDAEADHYQRQYLDLIAGLADAVDRWPENEPTDTDHVGPIPRVNVSLKLSALFPRFNPADPEGTYEGVAERLRPVLRLAKDRGAFVNFDMEQYSYKDATLNVAKRVLTEPEFRDWPHAGVVIQAYLRDAEQDLEDLRSWAEDRGTAVSVRLVKGAYWDYETVSAAARGWPVPVYTRKADSDACFERCTEYLMAHYELIRPAIASHNLRSLSHAEACADALGVPDGAWEVQMLYGMAGEQAELFRDAGHRVRIYTPFGEAIPGMAYLVRRLLENGSNDSFVKTAHDPDADPAKLFQNPAAVADALPPEELDEKPRARRVRQRTADRLRRRRQPRRDGRRPGAGRGTAGRGILPRHRRPQRAAEPEPRLPRPRRRRHGRRQGPRGDPPRRRQRRRRRQKGLPRLGEDRPRAPGGIPGTRRRGPAPPAVRAGRVDGAGGRQDLGGGRRRRRRGRRLLQLLRQADAGPRRRPRRRRAGRTQQADVSPPRRRRRDRPVELPAGDPHRHDRRRAGHRQHRRDEAGRAVPRRRRPADGRAARGGRPRRRRELPAGQGEEVGPPLVTHKDVAVVAFTGSREVGLAINEQAAKTPPGQDHVKVVLAEMGGKNAIVVDSDADLDEAVLGVLHSAVDFAGQKCSACSRAVVVADAHDEFVRRLRGAVESLKMGRPADPGTQVGPVIDGDSVARIEKALKNLGEDVELAATLEPGGDLPAKGHWVAPRVYTGVSADDPLATDELFGPVLAVIKVKTFAEAIEVANATDYALTAGVFSRSPENLETARRELVAGNIYLNRGCTGALVNRQPFGGYKLSGVGCKAGGPNYLHQFLVPVNVTENTMRRGFAPSAAKSPQPKAGE